MKNLLITGATGFIGSHLTNHLYDLGYNLKLLVRETSNISPFERLTKLEYLNGDIRDIESIRNAVDNIDAICHLAAYTGIWAKDDSIYTNINVNGTENVARTAIEKDIRLIYASSFTAIGPTPPEPVNESYENEEFNMPYEESKFKAKRKVKEMVSEGLKATLVYPGIVYGPGDFNIFGDMLYNIVQGKILPLGLCPGEGQSIACFTYVYDLVKGIETILNNENTIGKDYILGGENVKFREYLDLIASIARGKKVRKIPMWIASVYARLLETKANITNKTPKLTCSTLNAIKFHRAYSSQKAIKEINYKITPLKEGLEETIAWYKSYAGKSKE